MAFQIEPYSVADFLEWHRANRLRLNPDFQRREVWSNPEKTLLIDTILREYSMPKIYFRTVIDATTQQMIRDVVDGQQRLKAIIAFSEGKLKLSSKAGEYSGLTYADLPIDLQQKFLQYRIATEQLINATDDQVVNIFTRLNQYGVKLNQAELRNAEFSNDIKWFVVSLSQKYWRILLDNNFITLKQRSRMLDDELMAELVQVHIKGIQGGDPKALRSLYTSAEANRSANEDLEKKIDNCLGFAIDMSDQIPDQIKSRSHFVLFYGAIMNAIYAKSLIAYIDESRKNEVFRMPRDENEMETLADNLAEIARVIASEEVPSKEWEKFYLASRSAPVSPRSRKERFTLYAMLFSERAYGGAKFPL